MLLNATSSSKKRGSRAYSRKCMYCRQLIISRSFSSGAGLSRQLKSLSGIQFTSVCVQFWRKVKNSFSTPSARAKSSSRSSRDGLPEYAERI